MEKRKYTRIGEELHLYRLSNGLPVLFAPRRGFERSYALFATRYGGMDLRFQLGDEWLDTPAGIAHFLEHKMFDTQEGNALQELAKNGAEPNAFTSNAITVYYFDSTEHFLENLKILLSFVSIPYFTPESVDKEQGIIAQEIGMIEDNPDWVVYKNLMAALYEKSPARISVAGSVESIAQITDKTLYDCHRAFYVPCNMCLVIVGEVDEEAVLNLAEEILPAESGTVIPRDYARETDLTPHEKEVRCAMEVSAPLFLAGFKCPEVPEGEERMRRSILGELACDVLLGDSGPLYARLYAEGLINGSFDSSYDVLPGVSYVSVGGESRDPQAVVDAILEEAQRLVREGIDADYFRRILRANFGTAIKSLNSFESIAVGLAEGCFGGYDAYRFPEIYDAVTAQDLVEFIRENICESRMAVSIIEPKEENDDASNH